MARGHQSRQTVRPAPRAALPSEQRQTRRRLTAGETAADSGVPDGIASPSDAGNGTIAVLKAPPLAVTQGDRRRGAPHAATAKSASDQPMHRRSRVASCPFCGGRR